MKANFQKHKSIIFDYRNYKSFNNDFFRNELMNEINKNGSFNISCKKLEMLFMTILIP